MSLYQNISNKIWTIISCPHEVYSKRMRTKAVTLDKLQDAWTITSCPGDEYFFFFLGETKAVTLDKLQDALKNVLHKGISSADSVLVLKTREVCVCVCVCVCHSVCE